MKNEKFFFSSIWLSSCQACLLWWVLQVYFMLLIYVRELTWCFFLMLYVGYFQEFKRIKGNINSMREHAELLSSVRDDISDFKVGKRHYMNLNNVWFVYGCIRFYFFWQASGSMSPRVQLLRERSAIHGSISHVSIYSIKSIHIHS